LLWRGWRMNRTENLWIKWAQNAKCDTILVEHDRQVRLPACTDGSWVHVGFKTRYLYMEKTNLKFSS
jgi:hypothetical protein